MLGATSAAVSHGSGLLASRARLLLTPLSPGGHSPGLNLFRMFTTHQIRKLYLDYFQTKGHTLVPGCSLVPPNDKSLLFTNSGTSPSSSAPGLLSGSQSFFFFFFFFSLLPRNQEWCSSRTTFWGKRCLPSSPPQLSKTA